MRCIRRRRTTSAGYKGPSSTPGKMRNAHNAVGPLRRIEQSSLPGYVSSVNALGSLWIARTLDYCAAVTEKGHLEVGIRVFEQQSVLVMLNLPDPVETAGKLR